MRVALFTALLLAACTFDTRLPSGTAVKCTKDADCQDGHRCQVSLGTCVASSELDLTPPSIDSAVSVRFVPRAESRLTTPTAMGPLTDVRLSFTVSEVLAADPAVTFSRNLGITCTTQREGQRQYHLLCVTPGGNGVEDTLAIQATLVDVNALEATVRLAQMPYDDVEPAAPDTVQADSLVIRQLPWGDRNDEKSRTTVILAPGIGAAPRNAGFAEFSAGSTSVVVALRSGLPTQTELPLSTAPASLRLIDAAGNRSPASVAHWFEWVASPRSTTFTRSPHTFAAYPVFPLAPLAEGAVDAGDDRSAWLIDGTVASVPHGVLANHYGFTADPLDFLRGVSANMPMDTFHDEPVGEVINFPDAAVSFFGNVFHDGMATYPATYFYEPWSQRAVTTVQVDGGFAVYGCRFDAGCTRLGGLPPVDGLQSSVDIVSERAHIFTAQVVAARVELKAFRVGTELEPIAATTRPINPLDLNGVDGFSAILGPRGESARIDVTTSGDSTSTSQTLVLALADASVPDAAIETVSFDRYTGIAYAPLGNDVESPRRRAPCLQPFMFSATGATRCNGPSTRLADGGLLVLVGVDGGLPSYLAPAVVCAADGCATPQFRGASGVSRSWSTNEVYIAADAGSGIVGVFSVVDNTANLITRFPAELMARFGFRVRGVPHEEGPIWVDQTPSLSSRRVFRLVATSLLELAPLPGSVSSLYTDPNGGVFAAGGSVFHTLTDAGWSTRPLVGGAPSNVTWDPIANRPVGFGGELTFATERPGFVFVVDPSWFLIQPEATLMRVQLDVEGGARSWAEDGGVRPGLELGHWPSPRFLPGAQSEHLASSPGPGSLRLEGAALTALTRFHKRWVFGVRPAGTNGRSGADLALDGLDVSARYFVP